ncbi:MAG: DUF1801 domain-containing protein [Ferruginibacter sp.]|nr:DUF1801 domain-containing protein [Bacteroidota bacterium]MBX2918110.1 DUF1801 domain-containing protein [Ferruginibacter sp.]MCB0709667.1 DUF1801 domain-containing protein [Chitinophagaceae bacterium]MCC7378832.1 DUF1801 domain-containing protein [Chitinophagaceae bacterium]
MQTKAATVEQYIDALPHDRKSVVMKLRKVIKKNLPKGFKECMNYGMIGYVVPHALYPTGYHCNPKEPLPFMNIASQKNFVAVYSMSIYANPALLKWFVSAYTKAGAGKLDMGKSCIRFKKMDKIPFELIGELASKITVEEWIAIYEKTMKK